MAFAPSWGGKYSKYDPNAPVNPKRAKEIFPQDFINIFLRIVGEATTAKVARLTIKELAKKNGGKAGLHDLFIERPLDLSKQLTARQIKYAEKLVNKTREDCAEYVVLMEHKRRLAFGAAIRISIYVRGYLAKKLTQKRRVARERKIRDDNASSKIQALVRGVQGRCRFQELQAREFLWQRRGRHLRYLERAVVKETNHVRNDPAEKRISFILMLADGDRWNEHLIGATVTQETAPNLVDPSHPEGGMIKPGEDAVLFAHYGVMPSGGRRAPVVICRTDMKPSTRLEISRFNEKRAAAAAASPFRAKRGSKSHASSGRSSSPSSGRAKKNKRGKGKGKGKKGGAKQGSPGSPSGGGDGKDATSSSSEVVMAPKIPFHDSTSPIQYILMLLGGQALPASFYGHVGQRLERNEREDFYVLQHMSGFLGRDLVKYLASRRELPALASPDGSGQDGKWAKDRRRLYWETTNQRHHCILPHRRRVHSVKDKEYKREKMERIKRHKLSVCISPLWESVHASNTWRLIFFHDDGVLNSEDTLRYGHAPIQSIADPKTGHTRMTKYSMTTDPYSLDSVMVQRLVSVCNEVGAKLICCSNRRETHALQDQLTETLHNAGLPLTSFLGFTPKLDRPAEGPSRRLAEVYTWLLEQDKRRIIESWVIVDKLDLYRGDARDKVMLWNASRLTSTVKEKALGEMFARAVDMGYVGRPEAASTQSTTDTQKFDIRKHFCRTHLRKGLDEERAGELRRLLLLPKKMLMEGIQEDLEQRKLRFEERSEAFIEGMPKEGPFVPGLKTKESNRRLEIFRKVFLELIETMEYLDINFKRLRSIVDGDSFLQSDFKWDSGKHRRVRSMSTELNKAHDKIMSVKRAHDVRHQELACLKKGGRFCPRCTNLVNAPPDFLTNAESNKWLLCQNEKCGFNFCQRCGASKGPIIAHGLYRHCFGCQFYKGLKEGVDNGPLRYWSAASTEVKRGRKKAGDVRCGDCCKMTRDTEVCPSPEGLPNCWSKDKDPDPKLKRIRNCLAEREKEQANNGRR